MDHDTKKFIKQAKHEIRMLTAEPSIVECTAAEREEVELMMRTSIGGSAGLGYFIPMLWRTYRHHERGHGATA